MTFGQQVRALRDRCRYPQAGDFVERSGVSLRTLQYVEADQVLPRRATLDKILTTAEASIGESQRLRRLRDLEQARRDGFDLPETDELLAPRLADRITTETLWLLRHYRVADRHRRALQARIGEVVRDVLAPPVP